MSAYLTLVTEIVAEAIRHGATRLEAGTNDLRSERALGAEMSARWLYIKCPSPAVHFTLRAASRPLVSRRPRRRARVFRDAGAGDRILSRRCAIGPATAMAAGRIDRPTSPRKLVAAVRNTDLPIRCSGQATRSRPLGVTDQHAIQLDG